MIAFLLLMLSACDEAREVSFPTGYMETCTDSAECDSGLACFAYPDDDSASEHICSSECETAGDCPAGTKECGDGVAQECRSGMCYYSEFCY